MLRLKQAKWTAKEVGLSPVGLLKRLLLPLKDIQFDEDKGNQPQERIPEIHEVAFDSPKNGRQEQGGIENNLAQVADAQCRADKKLPVSKPNVDFQHQYHQ